MVKGVAKPLFSYRKRDFCKFVNLCPFFYYTCVCFSIKFLYYPAEELRVGLGQSTGSQLAMATTDIPVRLTYKGSVSSDNMDVLFVWIQLCLCPSGECTHL